MARRTISCVDSRSVVVSLTIHSLEAARESRMLRRPAGTDVDGCHTPPGGKMRFDMRDYTVRWGVIAGIGLLAPVCLHSFGVSLDLGSTVPSIKAVGELLLLLLALIAFRATAPRFGNTIAVPVDMLLSLVQLFAFVQASLPFSYMSAAVAAGIPLLDDRLASLDAVLFGFHWA